jgi:hypothetical protein
MYCTLKSDELFMKYANAQLGWVFVPFEAVLCVLEALKRIALFFNQCYFAGSKLRKVTHLLMYVLLFS